MEIHDEFDIEKNLQTYVKTAIREVHKKKTEFDGRSWYPEEIKNSIYYETLGLVDLDLSSLALTKKQKKDIPAPKKLAEKYVVY